MPTDIAIGTANLSTVAPVLKRPIYLITLNDLVQSNKSKGYVETQFIAIDRPGLENGFIAVRGIYTDLTEEEVIKRFSEILTTAPKDSILEMMFPTHRIKSIRSLVFNAVKPTMITR